MITDLFMALGALGLILLGMDWMTQGLKLAAGPGLVQGLQRFTGSPLSAVAIGTAATVAVQSSSAVTVTIIGFVNANILSLRNAAYVIYGSNVGTSFTGWFVALVGLQFKIDALALPVIGIGIVAKTFVNKALWQGIGQGIAGFGLLFLGIGFLKTSFDAVFLDIEFDALAQLGIMGLLLAVLIGAVLSTLMQASAAVIALVITAVATGALPLTLGAAFVIGANLGTTSTALLSTLAATAKAKRLAWLHLIFNVLTGVVALLILQPLLWLIVWLQQYWFDSSHAAFSLALFHTLFNVLGVLLMWPITGRLVIWLNQKFRGQAMLQLTVLDRSSLALPALALKTLSMEQQRVLQGFCQLMAQMIKQPIDQNNLDELKQLQRDIASFAGQLGQQALSSEESKALQHVTQSQLRLEMLFQMVPQLEKQVSDSPAAFQSSATFWQQLAQLQLPEEAEQIARLYRDISRSRLELKQQLHIMVMTDRLSHDDGGRQLLQLAELRRFHHQLTKAMYSIASVQQLYSQAHTEQTTILSEVTNAH
ncbi:Na/Pi symporter [Alkalimonas collagenimarina]|uniref:Na/Pi symporter n=1 Tax=Alkalimonas collagenimarina TaxID=400390 RepID=A0ABT9GUZ7_9GAMM|nr:Na/Pi symporter [Alkalimonas collagenimarina]MDP4534851.1 Na/Pi symporter [Alkalimonas collagenimarina]